MSFNHNQHTCSHLLTYNDLYLYPYYTLSRMLGIAQERQLTMIAWDCGEQYLIFFLMVHVKVLPHLGI